MATILTEAQLISMVRRAEARLGRAAVNAIIASRNALGTRAELAALIEAGRIDEAVTAAARAGAIDIAQAGASVYTLTGATTAAALSTVLDVTVDFDQVHDFAVERMRENRLRHVRDWTDNQRDVAREVLNDGVERGLNPREQARGFRDATGLTAHQERAVQNYRRALENAHRGAADALSRELRDHRFDSTVARAAREAQPLTPAQIDRMVERYRERAIKRRAETIARTESMRSVNAGNYDALRMAVDDGVVAESDIYRTWVATNDERTRETHVEADGQEVGLNEAFTVGSAMLMYPVDENGPPEETIACRCTAVSRIR